MRENNIESVENIRIIFRKISAMQIELKKMDSSLYQQFKKQISGLSVLEDYNFRKIVTDSTFKPVDTLKMRQEIINKWGRIISNNQSISETK